MEESTTILIVDDEAFNRDLINEHIETLGYQGIEAENGKEAVEIAIEQQPDLIIMDIMMPVLDGFKAIAELKKLEATKHIPVIIATALGARDEKIKGISVGADDYLTKPIDFEELSVRVENVLAKKRYTNLLQHQNEILHEKVIERTREIQKAFVETTHRLTLAAEYKDPETGEHIKRISLYSKALAIQLKQDAKFVDEIFHAAAMHDIGKVGIPDGILLKPASLNEDEWQIMKSHSYIGARILQNSTSALLKMAYEIAYSHHEKWDGSGYPKGLKGVEIPLAARIMSICDQYDALRSKRPYKEPFSHEKTMTILLKGDERTHPEQFDPLVFQAFQSIAEQFDEIFNSYEDEEARDQA